jgi:hypothetical protein
MSANEYAEQYRTALLTYAALTGENKEGLVAIVRTGLVAIAMAPGTIAEKAKKTGVSQAKVGRDIITGLWLAAHPNEDAVKVKACGNKLSQTKMEKCDTLKELRAMMPKKVTPPKDEQTETETETEETETPDTKGSKPIVTPDDHALAIIALAGPLAAMYHNGTPPTAEIHNEAVILLNALTREIKAYAKTCAAA